MSYVCSTVFRGSVVSDMVNFTTSVLALHLKECGEVAHKMYCFIVVIARLLYETI